METFFFLQCFAGQGTQPMKPGHLTGFSQLLNCKCIKDWDLRKQEKNHIFGSSMQATWKTKLKESGFGSETIQIFLQLFNVLVKGFILSLRQKESDFFLQFNQRLQKNSKNITSKSFFSKKNSKKFLKHFFEKNY